MLIYQPINWQICDYWASSNLEPMVQRFQTNNFFYLVYLVFLQKPEIFQHQDQSDQTDLILYLLLFVFISMKGLNLFYFFPFIHTKNKV